MSGTLKHDEFNEGFDRLHAGEVVRQVVCSDRAVNNGCRGRPS